MDEWATWIEEQYTASLNYGGTTGDGAGDIAAGQTTDTYYSGTQGEGDSGQITDYSGGGTNDGGGFDASAYTGMDADASRNPSAPIGTASQTRVEESTVLSKIKDFAKLVEQNKTLSKMVLDGIGGAAAQRNKAKSDQMLLQQRAELEAAAVALKRQNNSASVAGLKPIPRTGLLGGLKRTTGAPVFNGRGLLGSAG